ncbi:hypothetical protein BD410DRAFT_788881 [Rickenella mellea]|uniref:Uncharacterized protein n=1 Tax=Rickenella mellea TaxID=50990 RepID=A0A4Y7Q4C6_9AGAM|nr:hypothetical protein BD410DRAFT_788881 [Rickenella mellea]
MVHSELWLVYKQVSRCGKPATAQLIELEFQNHKLHDLEDVLEHVFEQGFVDATLRPLSWWEKCDGAKVKGCIPVEELLDEGVGRSQETALRLVIADVPPALWFSYVYKHNPTEHVVTQRVKLDAAEKRLDILAHVTNHIFRNGFLPAHLRSKVYWQGKCGKVLEEHLCVEHVLGWGDGKSEETPLRLVIDDAPCHVHVHSHCSCKC